MTLGFDETLALTLRHRSNAYDSFVCEFEERTGCSWKSQIPPYLARGRVSVVIPACDMAYSLPSVLDALAAQEVPPAEVIVVDDGSTDGTFALAETHPLRPVVVRVPTRLGSATARNLGVALAVSETVVLLDSDMVLPPHAIADVSARARDGLVLLGFRHNVAYQADPTGPVLPSWPADLEADHRVRWHAPAGQKLLYTGITLDSIVDGRPLEATDGCRQLGYGRTYYDWDLPRMVVTALLAVPRDAVLDVGGFDARFGALGWGCEDTHLGAALIGLGLMIAPLPQLVGYHINPPDEAASWAAKLATWPDTIALYRDLLQQPPPHGLSGQFHKETQRILQDCQVTR